MKRVTLLCISLLLIAFLVGCMIGFPGNGDEKRANYAFSAYGWDHYQNWGFQYWVQGKLVQSGKVP